MHRVDSNNMLSCEAYNLAIQTADSLKTVATPLADDLIESLREDENRNLMVTFKLKGSTQFAAKSKTYQ